MSEFTRNEAGRLCHVKYSTNQIVEIPDGPWHAEPDRDEWRSMGAFCGYVAVPVTHPWVTGDVHEIDVHGGITYGPEACSDDICHVPHGGESDDVRWFGFDCSHAGDFSLSTFAIRDHMHAEYERYRDLAFVKEQTEHLAMQAARWMVQPDEPDGLRRAREGLRSAQDLAATAARLVEKWTDSVEKEFTDLVTKRTPS